MEPKTTRDRHIEASVEALKQKILRSLKPLRRKNDDGKKREIILYAR